MFTAIVIILVFLVIFEACVIFKSKLGSKIKADPFYKEYNKGLKGSEPDQASLDLEDKAWHEEETGFVFRLHEQISARLEPSKVAKYITEGVHNFLGADKTVLLMLDKRNQKFKVEYAMEIDKGLYGDLSFAKNESISGFVMSQKRPLLVEDLQKNHHLKRINKESYLSGSFISVPLMFQNKVLGVLNVCGKKSRKPFTRRDFSFLVNIGRVGAIVFQNVNLHEQIERDYLRTITALALTIDARDPYTKCHSDNVTKYCLAIAKELKLANSQIDILEKAALLHDIGKIAIRDNVLLKPGRLTEEEFKEIKLHPEKGEAIIKSLPFMEEVAFLIRHHHERYDGKGYPDGLKGDNIEIGARIMAVADTFDAMTSNRPYRKQLSHYDALSELKKFRGTQFDSKIVDAFLEVYKKGDLKQIFLSQLQDKKLK